MLTFTQDPQAKLDYALDWRQWLGSDHIASFTFAVNPVVPLTGLTVASSPAPDEEGGVVTFWLQGGAEEEVYEVTCRIVTEGGRTDDRTIGIKIKQR